MKLRSHYCEALVDGATASPEIRNFDTPSGREIVWGEMGSGSGWVDSQPRPRGRPLLVDAANHPPPPPHFSGASDVLVVVAVVEHLVVEAAEAETASRLEQVAGAELVLHCYYLVLMLS